MDISIGHHTAVALLSRTVAKGSLVADLGAFPGGLTRVIKKEGWNVIAIDKDPDRGLTLQHRFKEGASRTDDADEPSFTQSMQDIGVETRVADLEASPLPFANKELDAALLTEVIEHLCVNPLFTLAEINRSLKPGGVLLISTPNLTALRRRIHFLDGNMEAVIEPPYIAFLKKIKIGHVGHVRLYDPNELKMMLTLLGFESEFHYYNFEFWDPGPKASKASEDPSAPIRPLKRPVWRKLLRSPADYFRAAKATLIDVLERRYPHFRVHRYVVARKVKEADFERLSLADFAGVVDKRP